MAKDTPKVGRPTSLDEETRRKIEEVASLDGSVEEMAYYAGVHRATLYRWLQEDPEFNDRIQGLRERPVLKARQTVIKSLDNPDHAFKYLERKKRNEFATRTETDITTGGEKITDTVTPEQKAQLLSLLNDKGGSN